MTSPPLTEAQRNALDLIWSADLYRVRDGWQGRGTPRVAMKTADVLLAADLIRIDTSRAHPRLVLTDKGRVLR